MGALALIVPSGYSIGPLLLLLVSISLLFLQSPYSLTSKDRWIILTLVVYGVVVGGLSIIDLGAKGFDRPLRFLLAFPVLLLILRFPPRQTWLWSGLSLGAIGAGSWGLWQRFGNGIERVGGYLHPIQFGNLSMLMGVLCLAGLGWAVLQRRRAIWVVLLLLGALLGMLGSLMSGSRGGWVGLPVIGYVLYRGFGRQLPLALKVSVAGLVVTLATLVFVLPQTGVQQRVNSAISDISLYVSGEESNTSLGLRFEMWRGASQLIIQRPLLGWGESGYEAEMINLGQQQTISPVAAQFGHAHNEFIDALAKRGVVGLAALVMLYMVPLKMFASGVVHENLQIRALALAGTLLPVAFIDFGLSQTFLAHNSGAMFYAFWLAVIWGCYSAYSRALQN
ncbi:O-antigen ligase family protein [Vreelandella alkaliphila]|uniref:O-antigen ligase family protein n=1 Tax=Vreelandella TaxID=3137766 RepID=UPI003557BB15